MTEMNWEEFLRMVGDVNPDLYRWIMTGTPDNKYFNAIYGISPDLYSFVISKRFPQQGQAQWVNNPMKYTQEAYNIANSTGVYMPDAPLPNRWTKPAGYYDGRNVVINSRQNPDYVLGHELGHRFDDIYGMTINTNPMNPNTLLGREQTFEQAVNLYKNLFSDKLNPSMGKKFSGFPGVFGNPKVDGWGGITEFYAELGMTGGNIPQPFRQY